MLAEPFDVDYACPSEEYETLALECITYDPERRPTAPEVVRRLETIRQAYGGAGFTTPDLAKVDLTEPPVKTSGVLYVPSFGTSHDIWCEINVDDTKRTPVKSSVATGGALHRFMPVSTTIANIEPLSHTLEVLIKTQVLLFPKTIGKVSIPLSELLTLEGDDKSLTAVRTKQGPIVHEGDNIGTLEFRMVFGPQIRGYLEVFERETTEFLKKAIAGPKTLDLSKKRDVAAAALLASTPKTP
ncbi:hypothetical protein SDRG_03879 [Saprolegnia diclina VS20]|nr:hypothetical protein SDRG_03879 [Saprolegnia diclina VS20]EQC38921.1 hypothetical protein SDRG_03879 [Saprolegnia diclina VS20]|eukprot:XP_008607745.1 hypothetical protein SDRG_03879 [Saprolegnia diclina VS20]